MKKKLFFAKLLILTVVFGVNAQIGFEGFLHDYQNGANLNNGFHSNNYQFVNYYNALYDSWSGFAQSKMTDTTTAGFANQYSAMAGSGNGQSQNYLVSYVSSWDGPDYFSLDTATILNGFYITNSTYAYINMRDGDAVGKKFGGTTGDDPDWFLLTVKGYNNGIYTDSVNFYLADFRFTDNTQDYIIKDWTFVDLTTLTTVDSLVFELSSSDNGAYGMNTPAFFCVDDITNENNVVTDFEEFDFDYYNGSDLAGGFTNGEGYFYNDYDAGWGVWSGFSISRKTDITTPGWANQYSAITGEGFNSSEAYGVSYDNSAMVFDSIYTINSIWITNSTYAYLSMRDGDTYAKQFGGPTGDDPDWFLLTIKAYKNNVYIDSVNFYLADFRFTDNSQDYLINQWTEISLSALGELDSLSFSLSSSDVGTWGMNTPAYFCIDEISILNTVSADNYFTNTDINIYPNPAKDYVNISNTLNSRINIYNLSGKLIYTEKSYQKNAKINLSDFEKGIYIISINNEKSVKTYKIVKQ